MCIRDSPYALQETMRILNLKPEELLMVDDLKPGYDMAKALSLIHILIVGSEHCIRSFEIPVIIKR